MRSRPTGRRVGKLSVRLDDLAALDDKERSAPTLRDPFGRLEVLRHDRRVLAPGELPPSAQALQIVGVRAGKLRKVALVRFEKRGGRLDRKSEEQIARVRPQNRLAFGVCALRFRRGLLFFAFAALEDAPTFAVGVRRLKRAGPIEPFRLHVAHRAAVFNFFADADKIDAKGGRTPRAVKKLSVRLHLAPASVRHPDALNIRRRIEIDAPIAPRPLRRLLDADELDQPARSVHRHFKQFVRVGHDQDAAALDALADQKRRRAKIFVLHVHVERVPRAGYRKARALGKQFRARRLFARVEGKLVFRQAARQIADVGEEFLPQLVRLGRRVPRDRAHHAAYGDGNRAPCRVVNDVEQAVRRPVELLVLTFRQLDGWKRHETEDLRRILARRRRKKLEFREPNGVRIVFKGRV